jgi:hypothetical protein
MPYGPSDAKCLTAVSFHTDMTLWPDILYQRHKLPAPHSLLLLLVHVLLQGILYCKAVTHFDAGEYAYASNLQVRAKTLAERHHKCNLGCILLLLGQ